MANRAPVSDNSWVIHFYQRFIKLRGTPHEIGMGLSLGVVVALTPFLGLHTAMAVFTALLFKWNKIAAALGVWITNPLTAPVIYPITLWIGVHIGGFSRLSDLPRELTVASMAELLKKAPMLLLDLTIGGMVVAVPLAIVAYYVSVNAITQYRIRKQKRARKRPKKPAKPKKRLKLKK